MRKHITLKGMTTGGNGNGECAVLVNIASDGTSLRPLAAGATPLATLAAGTTLVGLHRHGTSTHLIAESGHDGQWTYQWVGDDGKPHPLFTTSTRATGIAATGAMLCLTSDAGPTYCLWQPQQDAYAILRRDDLLYDLAISQDQQTACDVAIPITGSTATHLDHPHAVERQRHTLLTQLFDGYYDRADAYATGATMVVAQMEAAISAETTRRGAGMKRHVVFGIAALRLSDGSHLMHSGIFALLPAALTDTLTADRDNQLLRATVWLHRHTISATMRTTVATDTGLVAGIDIFLTRPQHGCDLRQATDTDSTAGGLTTRLTFAPADTQQLLQRVEHMTFYHAMTIRPDQMGTPLLVGDIAAGAEGADLSDLRRMTAGARTAFGHGGRLSLADATPLLHDPWEIGLRYHYGDLVAGTIPDTNGNADGTTADLITHALTDDDGTREVWWHQQVQYPIPGMMMVPHRHLTVVEHHLRLPTAGGYRYYTTRQTLTPLSSKGAAVAIYTAAGQAHRPSRPALLSLLLQQVRGVAYDADSGTYTPTYPIWEEEQAADYERYATKARASWALSRRPSLLLTSAEDNPLVFPSSSQVRIGNGAIRSLAPNTRRTADGLYGDGQYYAFCSDGVWLLRLSKGRWNAQQAVSRLAIIAGTRPICTDDSVAFVSPQGLMMVHGSKVRCLSTPIEGLPMPWGALPHSDRLLATESQLPPWSAQRPGLGCLLNSHTQLAYDATHHHLWLFSTALNNGQRQWPGTLVCALDSGSWSIATQEWTSAIGEGADGTSPLTDGKIFVTLGDGTLAQVEFGTRGQQVVLACTDDIAIGSGRPVSIGRLLVRGLFQHRGPQGSHIGVALYGSNDRTRWHLIGSSANQYLCHHHGTPYRWHRIVIIGAISTGESIEGVSVGI